jgi:hypothetical protein
MSATLASTAIATRSAKRAIHAEALWRDQDNRGGPQLFGQIFNLSPGTREWKWRHPDRDDQGGADRDAAPAARVRNSLLAPAPTPDKLAATP